MAEHHSRSDADTARGDDPFGYRAEFIESGDAYFEGRLPTNLSGRVPLLCEQCIAVNLTKPLLTQ